MNKKTKFGFIEAGQIMAVVVSLIIIAVGMFAFFTVTNVSEEQGIGASGQKCFAITTPTNPETLTGLPSNTINISYVREYYDDGTNALIDPADWVWSIATPTTIDVSVTGG